MFSLSDSDLRRRIVDHIDIVKDVEEKDEDPTTFISEKTKRGPLQQTWVKDYWEECQVRKMTGYRQAKNVTLLPVVF